MSWFQKNRSNRVDPEHLTRKAHESLLKTSEQQPRVNLVSSWLIWRTGDNGFGGDFEFTLIPKSIRTKGTQ